MSSFSLLLNILYMYQIKKIQLGNTINNSLVKKVRDELIHYLNKYYIIIILSKSNEFIKAIIMKLYIKSFELVLVAKKKFNQLNTKVIQKLFDFYKLLWILLRYIFLSQLPCIIMQIKNKYINMKMKIEGKKY